MLSKHAEGHRINRIGWLRAAVLGANDGIISTVSLIVGVAAANTSHHQIIIAATAALFAGAMSMAAGEYVSVSSQADIEKAEINTEKEELIKNPVVEAQELASIYVNRGLDRSLAEQVAKQLTAHNALAAHARDELGITQAFIARPFQAAIASACSFTFGALLPVLVTVFTPPHALIATAMISAIFFLALLGGIAAQMGGASIIKGVIRVAIGGALAMFVSTGIGSLF